MRSTLFPTRELINVSEASQSSPNVLEKRSWCYLIFYENKTGFTDCLQNNR